MALIRPGIHENLVIHPETKWNDKGSFDLVISSASSADAELAAFESNAITTTMKSSIKFYPPNMTDFDKNVKTSADIAEELRKVRYQFLEYGAIFAPRATVEQYVGGVTMFEGLGIAPQDYGKAITQLTNKDHAEKVFKNLCDKFLAFLAAAQATAGTVMFRQKFLRQSKDKNWAVIPQSDMSVWIEPMTIPKAESKIAWSEWEIKHGKNDPNPSASTKAANTKATDVNAGKNLFAQPAAASAPAITQAPPVMPAAPAPIAAAPVAQAQPTMAAPPAMAPAPVVPNPADVAEAAAAQMAPVPGMPQAPVVPAPEAVTPAPVAPVIPVIPQQ